MSRSITLAGLAWTTPDGRQLFHNLDLAFGPERTGLVGRNGVGKSTLLRLVTGELQPSAGSCSVDGTIGMLRQSVQGAEHETIADLFGARAGLDLLARAARGKASAAELAEADWTLDERVEEALAQAGLDAGADTPLRKLSGGQATRAGLAALIFDGPDFLLLDEPTNNLDRDGRAAVIALLSSWRGGAIVVSHDRELLDTMGAIVELTTLGATRYGGNWSAYRERKAVELAAAHHDLATAEKEIAHLARAAQARTEKQDRRDSGGRRKGARGDMPKIVAGGLKRKAQETRAEAARLDERRGEQAREAADKARRRIEVLQPLSVSLVSPGLPSSRTVLRLDGITAGYEPGRPVLRDFSLVVTGPERIAVTGPNGSGKTTLLAVIAGTLAPWAGTVARPVAMAMLDQRVSLLDATASIAENFARLNPAATDNQCRAALARFMFRAEAALRQVGTLSGGQMLRAGLACVLGGDNPPPLLILDEPTNHLDIESLEAVEAGLRAYDGALMIVSHDEAFLAGVGITRRIQPGRPA